MSPVGTEFRLAAQFLTRLPVGSPAWSAAAMARSTRWFPAVGLLVGGIAALVLAAASAIWPPIIAALLAVAASALVTGALHEDGLADLADGLGGGRTPEHSLEIMRDSRIGAYGTLALILSIAARVALLAHLPVAIAAAGLVAGHAASRYELVWIMLRRPSARPDGAGAFASDGLPAGTQRFAAITLLAALTALAAVAGIEAAFLAWLGCFLAVAILTWRVMKRLGGWTGDALGASQQVGEIGFLLGLAAWV